MSAVLKIAVSQRVDTWAERSERRDALDQRLCQWLLAACCVPVPVPNALSSPTMTEHTENCLDWLHTIKPDAVLLSGGNDIGEAPERDNTESHLLAYARELVLPALGICRGMQMMAVWAGSSLLPVSGHVRTRHNLQTEIGSGEWPTEVNSFHNFTFTGCPQGFLVAARAEDGTIEAIRHETLPWEGWMWHPEREPQFNPIDIMRFRSLCLSRSVI